MLHFLRSTAALTLLVAAGAHAANAQTLTLPAPPGNLPSPPDSSSPALTATNPPENPLITARVTKEFLAWQRGKIDRSTYSPNAGGTYIDPLVALVAPDLAAIGTPQSTTYRTASLILGDLVYRYDIVGTSGAVSVLYALSQNGKTDGITFTPQIFRAAPVIP